MSGTTLPRAFRHAAHGVWVALRREPNLRIEVALGALAIVACWWLGAPLVPVLLAAAVVLTAELTNSAIEAAVDLLSPERHELARAAKDMAAGAVLIASLFAFCVGLAVLGPPLLVRLGVLK